MIKRIIISLSIIIIGLSIIPIFIVGSLVTDKEYEHSVDLLLAHGELSGTIIYNRDKPFIGTSVITPISRYYINHVGTIPYWTNMDTKISHFIDSCKEVQHKDLLKSIGK